MHFSGKFPLIFSKKLDMMNKQYSPGSPGKEQAMQVIRFDPQQMAQISDFLENLCDPAEMDREGLQQARQQVEETIGRLNRLEPRNEHTDAYDQWAQFHEDLEDVLDDILDLLD